MKKYIFLLFALLCANGLHAQHDFGDIDVEQLRKLQMAQMAITSLYVDSVDQKKLAEDAIRGMLDKLDPHSSYSNAKETKQLMATSKASAYSLICWKIRSWSSKPCAKDRARKSESSLATAS